jgi:hypothetical protein
MARDAVCADDGKVEDLRLYVSGNPIVAAKSGVLGNFKLGGNILQLLPRVGHASYSCGVVIGELENMFAFEILQGLGVDTVRRTKDCHRVATSSSSSA